MGGGAKRETVKSNDRVAHDFKCEISGGDGWVTRRACGAMCAKPEVNSVCAKPEVNSVCAKVEVNIVCAKLEER